MKVDSLDPWTVDNSVEMYGIRTWGAGYFDIAADGNVQVRLPSGNNGDTAPVKLIDLVAGLRDRGLMLPLVLRFGGILGDRIGHINLVPHLGRRILWQWHDPVDCAVGPRSIAYLAGATR